VSKIYEALEYAQQERKILKMFPDVRLPDEYSSEPWKLSMEVEMIGLYQTINALLPDSQKRIIQLIGSREGEGTSTLIREFSIVSAIKFDKLVLLLDADRKPSQRFFFNIRPTYGWDDVVRDDKPLNKAIYQIGETRLFISPLSQRSSSTQIFNSSKFDIFLKKSKEIFDLILIDSPPATVSSDGLAIAHKVDGIVLVLEAEKTRWPVAESVKDKIIKNGGNILGIILNKRRYYIPEFIYKQL
jgi:protein-tyrosine kinase